MMTQKQTSKSNENGVVGPHSRPDPEVLPRTPKAERRGFTVVYKQWLLEEAEKCREQPGGIGALLRREGLYSSHLTRWRRQQEEGLLAGLTPQKRGPKLDLAAEELNQLRQENARLTQQLEKAELIIEAPKKLSALLGITLEQGKGGAS
jgi:transposase